MKTFLDKWHKAECWLAVISFSFIALILILDVVGRELLTPLYKYFGYVHSSGIYGASKMAIFALMIGSFLGIGIATATGAHLVPRVGFKLIPAKYNDAMNRFADVLTGALCCVVAYYGYEYVMSSKMTGIRASGLDVVVYPFQTVIPLGFLSAALRYFVYAVNPSLRPAPPEFQE
jgi:TRAP-type C4-dicarboxylate transport system permease small subunit